MNKLFLSLGLIMALLLSNCSSADKANSISPADADALTEVLVIPNAQVVNSPDLPASSSPAKLLRR